VAFIIKDMTELLKKNTHTELLTLQNKPKQIKLLCRSQKLQRSIKNSLRTTLNMLH